MLAITLDNLAHRYNCLPSYALSNANTIDLYVLDVSSRWNRYQTERANGEVSSTSRPDEAEMLKMLERAKNDK